MVALRLRWLPWAVATPILGAGMDVMPHASRVAGSPSLKSGALPHLHNGSCEPLAA